MKIIYKKFAFYYFLYYFYILNNIKITINIQ